MYIDTHAHIYVDQFKDDISDVIAIQPANCDGAAGKRRELKFENTGQVRIVAKDCTAT